MQAALPELQEPAGLPTLAIPDDPLRFDLPCAGPALMALAATGTVGLWGYIDVVPLLIVPFSVCQAYSIFGMNTCGLRK